MADAEDGVPFLRAGGRFDFFEELIDDFVDVDALGLGPVVDEDAVPKRGMRERLDVIDGDVGLAAKQRAGLAAEHEELSRAQAGSPTDPFVDEARRTFLIGS